MTEQSSSYRDIVPNLGNTRFEKYRNTSKNKRVKGKIASDVLSRYKDHYVPKDENDIAAEAEGSPTDLECLYAQKAIDIIRLDPKEAEEVTQEIDQNLDRVSKILNGQDPKYIEAAKLVAELTKWATLKDPDTDLPEILVPVMLNRFGSQRPALAAHMSNVSLDILNYLSSHIEPERNRSDKWYNPSRSTLEKTQGLLTIMTEHYPQSKAVGFIKSFNQTGPQKIDAPIDRSWREILEYQCEDQVRQHFGIKPNEPMSNNLTALETYQRLVYRLDEQTMPKKQEAPKSGIQKFTEYVYSKIDGAIKTQNTNYRFSKFSIMEPYSDLEDEECAGAEDSYKACGIDDFYYIEVTDKSNGWRTKVESEQILGQVYLAIASDVGIETDGRLSELEIFIIETVVRRAIGRSLGIGNFQDFESLDSLINSQIEEVITVPISDMIDTKTKYMRLGQSPHFTTQALLAGNLPKKFVTEDELIAVDGNDDASIREYIDLMNLFKSLRVSSHSKNQIEQDKRTSVARILKEDPTNTAPMRLVYKGHFNPTTSIDLPESEHDLVIENHTFSPDGLNQISGYRLNKIRESYGSLINYYILDDQDPHDKCLMPIDPVKLADLAERYKQIGLGGEEFLTRLEDVSTVQDLVDTIISISDYVYADDHGVNDMYHRFDKSKATSDTLQKYKFLVKSGRLQLQCTGAADFLIKSLETLLDKDAIIYPITGYVLKPGNDKIDGVSHAQVALEYEGRRYILDATPPESGYGESHQRVKQFNRQLDHDTIITNSRSVSPVKSNERPKVEPTIEINSKSPEEKRAEILDDLKDSLAAILGVKNKELLGKELLKLNENDPMRLTVGAIMADQRGNKTDMPINRVLPILRGIKQADAETRRVLGVDHYLDHVLDILTDYLTKYTQIKE